MDRVMLKLRFEHLGYREKVVVNYTRSCQPRARLYGVSDGVRFNGELFQKGEGKELSKIFTEPKKVFSNLECTFKSGINMKKGEIKIREKVKN